MEVMISKANFSLDVHQGQGRYSRELLMAIRTCLAADPVDRPEPEEVLAVLEEMRMGGKACVYCIRLEAE
jgi:hypothetical protein